MRMLTREPHPGTPFRRPKTWTCLCRRRQTCKQLMAVSLDFKFSKFQMLTKVRMAIKMVMMMEMATIVPTLVIVTRAFTFPKASTATSP